MAIRKSSKVNAQFNMSSLTDIIFLLLIFFMLTSSIVAPNALNLKLPSSSKTPATSNETLDIIRINASGAYTLNGSSTNLSALAGTLRNIRNNKGSSAAVRIAPSDSSPTDAVVKVLDLARKNKVSTVLDATRN